MLLRAQFGEDDYWVLTYPVLTIVNSIEFPLSKNQTKWPIELWALKQEMETDEDHATLRESFSLVQNILFIEYTDLFPAHV